MTSVRHEPRPDMPGFHARFVQRCDRYGSAASFWNAEERPVGGSEQNGAIQAPAAPSRVQRVAQNSGWSAGDTHRLELAIGEESDEATVG